MRRISHVINYDVPDTVDAYTHRTGRTGRACETGDAFTFVGSRDEVSFRLIAKVLGRKLTYAAADSASRTTQPNGKNPSRQRVGRGKAGSSVSPASGTGRRPKKREEVLHKKVKGANGGRSSKSKGTLGVDLLMSLAGNPSSAA